MSVVKGEVSFSEAARKHGLTVAEVERWKEQFFAAGEIIALRAEADSAALRALPSLPYLVSERHIRTVGKDALLSFEASLDSRPWTLVRPLQRLELRVGPGEAAIYTLSYEPRLPARHPRARTRGSSVGRDRDRYQEREHFVARLLSEGRRLSISCSTACSATPQGRYRSGHYHRSASASGTGRWGRWRRGPRR